MFRKLLSVGLIGIGLPLVGGCPCCGTASCCTEATQSVDVSRLLEPDSQRVGWAGCDPATLDGGELPQLAEVTAHRSSERR